MAVSIKNATVTALPILFLMSACASSPTSNMSSRFSAAPIQRSVAAVPFEDYEIGPLDTLSLKVFREPDLENEALQVSETGEVQLPLIGAIRAEGLTTVGLADEIAARLSGKYLINPQVTVSLVSSFQNRVTVEGSVKRPGVYSYKGRATLLQAISLAEGPTEYAKLDQVVVFRDVDGQKQIARFSIKDIRRGLADDPALEPNDTVVIGYNSARRLFTDALVVIPSLAGIFIALIQN